MKAPIIQLPDSQINRESSSPSLSPVSLVTEKDDILWSRLYYKQLNAKARKGAYLLLWVEESLDALSQESLFSTIDLESGYNRVPVVEKDHAKAAFCKPVGLFQFNCMSFGLCNAPATFQGFRNASLCLCSHSLTVHVFNCACV